MEAHPPEDSDPLSQIDLSSAMVYMRRNNVGRMDFSIEALSSEGTRGDSPPEALETRTALAVLEYPGHITENEPPSPNGLGEVFLQVRVEE